nr:50S small subunit ribosomal protein L6 [Cryptococcus depauperatus CBS 7855]
MSYIFPALTVRRIHTTVSRQSHVGKVPIPIPPSVSLTLPVSSISPQTHSAAIEAQRFFTITGPLGSTTLPISPCIILSSPTSDTSALVVSVHDSSIKAQRSLWGLTRTLLNNAVTGVSAGFSLEVKLVGVGYRAALEPIPKVFLDLARQNASQEGQALPIERLNIKLGFSHPVLIDVPPEIKVTLPAPTKIVLSGTDKQRLGQFAAKIRQWRKPEPYRGKGIFVGDETIRLKEIKKK